MGVDVGVLAVREEIALDALKGKTLAIDGNNALYQFLASIRQPDGTPLMDAKGRVTSHLSGLFYRTARLLDAGVKPAYVFDGTPPHLKAKTIAERREIRSAAAEKWTEALRQGDLAGARTAAGASSRLTRQMVEEARTLLTLMGLPVVQAPAEGEAQAAYMCSRGDVFAAASQDYDALLLGAPRLVRNLTLSGRRKLPGRNDYAEVAPELVDLEKTLSANGITREQLVWMGVLIGTDFNEGVNGIGPKKALRLVKECSTLDEAVAKSGGEFEVEPREVAALFLSPAVATEYSLAFNAPDIDGLLALLSDGHDFSRERVEGTAKKISGKMADCAQQRSLDGWFG